MEGENKVRCGQVPTESIDRVHERVVAATDVSSDFLKVLFCRRRGGVQALLMAACELVGPNRSQTREKDSNPSSSEFRAFLISCYNFHMQARSLSF